MTIERDLKGRFVKNGTKNPKSYIWKKREKQKKNANRKGLTKENDSSVLKQSKSLSKTWKKQLKEGRTTIFIKGHKINLGKKHSEETKEKLKLHPSIGKNEKQILDELELFLKYKILRQYPIKWFYVDGYIPELNLVIEIDEKHHFDINNNLKEKDIKRQNHIQKELNCQFIRIKNV